MEVPVRDRRREKPLLSCLFCRSRKVRCDRQFPCKTCSSRGIGHSCTYSSGASRQNKVSVGDRIQQLEDLVRSLLQQQASSQATPREADVAPPLLLNEMSSLKQASLSHGNETAASPAPSESGSIHLHPNGVKYVGSVHWTAVLDSISELRDHYEEEEEARYLASTSHAFHHSPGPRLLYEPVHATKADLIASIPARPVVDRMVARYFNAQGIAPAILHSGHFLREYEDFWQDPQATPFTWIALLFSLMCVATQYQQSIEDSADPETPERARAFRERTIHALVLGEYTRGKEHVLETLINYVSSEMLLASNDGEIGLWLVQGIVVQLALSLGYHRDPKHFANVSPFAGEMRRRVWAVIVQLDLRFSSQMALPRLLRLQQSDTAEPSNLLDTDFDESTVELPPSRPETEVTPVLYNLAKSRIDKMSGLISDLINETQEHSYAEVMELDRKLQDAEASLPPIFQWQPLSRSFMALPQIVMHRVLLQLAIQRLTIWLHRKYLTPTYEQATHGYSRNACIQAAIKILEFRKIVDEETQRDGLLYSLRWVFTTSRLQGVFLLAISILCYYVELSRARPEFPLELDLAQRIHTLLADTYPFWVRMSTVSREAERAVKHLSLLLGLQDAPGVHASLAPAITGSSLPTFVPEAPTSVDEFTWSTYESYLADLAAPGTLGAEAMRSDLLSPSSLENVSMADLPLSNTADLNEWMEGQAEPIMAVLTPPAKPR